MVSLSIYIMLARILTFIGRQEVKQEYMGTSM